MQIKARYSHLNGWEYLQVHKPGLWQDVSDVICGVNAEACRTKESKEQRHQGRMLYSPARINTAFAKGFNSRGWKERRKTFYVTADEKLMRGIYSLDEAEQKKHIEAAGQEPLQSYNQTDFLKDRVAVEVQLGKYAFVAHDLFVKHLTFYVSDVIDVGIEILPMKEMEREMSSGVAYYERDLVNVIRQGRGVPAVPLILVGIAP